MTQMITAFFEFLKNYGKQEKVDKHPETDEKKGDNTKRVLKFLLQQFDFRYNRLTGVTEYRTKGTEEAPYMFTSAEMFKVMNKRNSVAL